MELKRLFLLTLLQLSRALLQESCGIVGVSTTPPYFTSTSPTLQHTLACGKHCASDGKCQSFGVGLGMCLHFALPLLSIQGDSTSGPWTLYEKDCVAIISHVAPPDDHCHINPNSTESLFQILSFGHAPLMPINEMGLGSLDDLAIRLDGTTRGNGSVAHFKEPTKFFLQKAAITPAGLYDLLVTGPELQYVAKAADGALVLTSASTGSTAQIVNGREIVTSIFTIDCDGRIGVMNHGIHYSWNINPNDGSITFSPGAHSMDSTIIALDIDKVGISMTHVELRSLEKRSDTFRCPSGQHAVTRAGARPPSANGCGSVKNHKHIPELGFHDCCNSHDFCYDNCDEQSCDHCNDAFFTCMKHICAREIPFKGIPCFVAAFIYYEAVKGSYGCPFFARYTGERCNCVPN